MVPQMEGNFDVTVRVTGAFGLKGVEAGVLISDGTNEFRFGRGSDDTKNSTMWATVPNGRGVTYNPLVKNNFKPVYIRLERRENVLTMKHSTDEQE